MLLSHCWLCLACAVVAPRHLLFDGGGTLLGSATFVSAGIISLVIEPFVALSQRPDQRALVGTAAAGPVGNRGRDAVGVRRRAANRLRCRVRVGANDEMRPRRQDKCTNYV